MSEKVGMQSGLLACCTAVRLSGMAADCVGGNNLTKAKGPAGSEATGQPSSFTSWSSGLGMCGTCREIHRADASGMCSEQPGEARQT